MLRKKTNKHGRHRQDGQRHVGLASSIIPRMTKPARYYVARMIAILIILATASTITHAQAHRRDAVNKSSAKVFTPSPGETLCDLVARRAAYPGAAIIRLPAGEYRYDKVLKFPPRTNVEGIGLGAVLLASPAEPHMNCALMPGSESTWQGLTIHGPRATKRSQSSGTATILVDRAIEVTLRNLQVQGSASAGILVEYSSHITIESCHVSHTLADGIHLTNGTSHTVVKNCEVSNTGDDAIATVSYQRKAPPCRFISIENNVAKDGKGRAFTCIGSQDVSIENNRGYRHEGGIYVAYEAAYKTHAPARVKVLGNYLEDCGRRHGMQGLLIGSAMDVIVRNNTWNRCLPAFIYDAGPGANRNIRIENNKIHSPIYNGHSPLEALDTWELAIKGNTITHDYDRPKIWIGENTPRASIKQNQGQALY